VYIPFNIHSNHWVYFKIELASNTITLHDPLPPLLQTQVKDTKQFLHKLAEWVIQVKAKEDDKRPPGPSDRSGIPRPLCSKLTWREMWEIDVVSIMKQDFIEKDKDRSKYGWLPKMATCSKGSIGSWLASSFCERINSCANQVLTLGNTLLGDVEMEKLVMCRMNRDFMVFMRKNYPQVADEQFEFGIIKAEDNEEKEDE